MTNEEIADFFGIALSPGHHVFIWMQVLLLIALCAWLWKATGGLKTALEEKRQYSRLPAVLCCLEVVWLAVYLPKFMPLQGLGPDLIWLKLALRIVAVIVILHAGRAAFVLVVEALGGTDTRVLGKRADLEASRWLFGELAFGVLMHAGHGVILIMLWRLYEILMG